MPSAARTNLPLAGEMTNQVICLPIYPELQTEQQDRVVDVIRQASSMTKPS
jgi:dTDP-4-amino-4,6-dideoxygalactose transaminase